MAINMTV